MMDALSFAIALPAFALLALSLAKHYRDLFGKPLSSTRARGFRIAGWLSLGTSLAVAIAGRGFAFGMILWAALLTVAALLVALSITYSNKWWRP